MKPIRNLIPVLAALLLLISCAAPQNITVIMPSTFVKETVITEPSGDLGNEEENVISPDYIIHDPEKYGYGPLPFLKPEISDADKNTFNPDRLSDYLINNLSDYTGCSYIKEVKLLDEKLNLVVEYDIHADAADAYQYLKDTFLLSDDFILNLKIFSDYECSVHDGSVHTQLAWDILNGTADDSALEGVAESGSDPNFIKIGELYITMPVADDATISLLNIDFDIPSDSCRLTTSEFANYILKGKSENHIVKICSNFWFKYSNGEITGIAEEYFP